MKEIDKKLADLIDDLYSMLECLDEHEAEDINYYKKSVDKISIELKKGYTNE